MKKILPLHEMARCYGLVCVHKPYVRPIERGKESKSVEFGAKCNNILVDGISFSEKLSFNAFNEGTRLPHCIKMHKRLFQRQPPRSIQKEFPSLFGKTR